MTRGAASCALALALLCTLAACGTPPTPLGVRLEVSLDAATRADSLTAAAGCPRRDAVLAQLGAWVEVAEVPDGAASAGQAPRARARVCDLARQDEPSGAVRVVGSCLLPTGDLLAVTLVYGRRELRLEGGALRWVEYTLSPIEPATGRVLDFAGATVETRFDADGDGVGNLAEECLGRDALAPAPLGLDSTGGVDAEARAPAARAPARPAAVP